MGFAFPAFAFTCTCLLVVIPEGNPLLAVALAFTPVISNPHTHQHRVSFRPEAKPKRRNLHFQFPFPNATPLPSPISPEKQKGPPARMARINRSNCCYFVVAPSTCFGCTACCPPPISTFTCFGLAASFLDSAIVNTPCSYPAFTLLVSTVCGRVKLRVNVP